MTQVLMVKRLSSLTPIDADGEAVLRRLGQGEIVTVDVKRPRNVAFHRRLFAMLQIVLENQETYQSIEELLDVCKVAVGHCTTLRTSYGEVKVPKSISFAAMDDTQFAAFYDRCVDWVLSTVIPGLERRHLDAEVRAALMEFAGDHRTTA